jgi:hypothetical protein
MLLGPFSLPVKAQELVLITCADQGPCLYRRVFGVSVQGKDTVKTVAASAANDPQLIRRARSVRLDSIPGLYRDPKSGMLRAGAAAAPGDLVLPSKVAKDGDMTASSAWEGATLEYRDQPKAKSRVPVPASTVVALLRGPGPEQAAVDFARNELARSEAHPRRKELVAGALDFAAHSEELRLWREELIAAMRASLDRFRRQDADPALFRATLEEGLAAARVYSLIAAQGQNQEALRKDLADEYSRLLQRFAIAGILKKAGLHDPFIEKMSQIGLARWSRPDLNDGLEASLRASGEMHYKSSTELFSAKQYARAFDEAQLAADRVPCDPKFSEYYYQVRVEYVNRNMIPAAPEYDNQSRSLLEQIVRELQGVGQEGTLTPERIEQFSKRIADGERLDRDYLPLQLKKAEFLANLGKLTDARDVVTRVERNVQLGRAEADEWLHLDASLNTRLATTRQVAEKSVAQDFADGKFAEALEAAAKGLQSDPSNRKLLYFSALASGILRDEQKTRKFAADFLRLPGLDCNQDPDATKVLFALYRRPPALQKLAPSEGKIPHWISGEFYRDGEVFYDPVSGGFFPHVLLVSTEKGTSTTEFHWEGFLATSIKTSSHSPLNAKVSTETTVFEAEPAYDREHVHMTAVGAKANSAGERKLTTLRYINSLDFDPVLAERYSNKVVTTGWAGNPFFHPFLWTGIFVFDLSYDELGRIKEAVPVTSDPSRPRSPFSERLKFSWDGRSKRLLSIAGPNYKRELAYDRQGRLQREKIVYRNGKGTIEYTYAGKNNTLKQARCEDNFFDRTKRTVSFSPFDQ